MGDVLWRDKIFRHLDAVVEVPHLKQEQEYVRNPQKRNNLEVNSSTLVIFDKFADEKKRTNYLVRSASRYEDRVSQTLDYRIAFDAIFLG